MTIAVLLSGCNVTTTDAREIKPETQCPNADLRRANLEAEVLSSANRSGADFTEAKYDNYPICPDGFDLAAAGPVLGEAYE